MIKIINLRTAKFEYPWDVLVDRKSVLGNPFYMHSEAERDRVCEQYAAWFPQRIAKCYPKDPIIQELERLQQLYKQYGKLRLFCWCAPKRCHAETIKNYLIGGN